MNARLVKLHFTAPVHFGEGRLSDSAYSCATDTLFSALFIEALGQGSDGALLEATQSGDLVLSDAFPFIGNTLYLPKPYAAPQTDTGAQESIGDSTQKKAAKKLKYLPYDSFGDYFAGMLDAVRLATQFREGLGAGGVTTKVSLQKEKPEDDPRPYQVGGFRFNEGAGLYFLVAGSYDIEPLLDTLQYSGFGGKRSAGYGRFTYELCDMPKDFLHLPVLQGKHMLLSTAAPTQDELTDELLQGSSYSLLRRSGFVQSGTYAANPQKKRDLYAFAAGSVFTQRFNGGVFDVSSGGAHPVWRYAKAFWTEG